MRELVSLLEQALQEGAVEITLRIRFVPPADHEGKSHTVSCSRCGKWSRSYSNSKSAARGLRAHHQHCSSNTLDLQWIADMHNTESDGE